MKTHPGAELFLSRFAEGEWRGIVRPWLEDARGTLARSLVVVPTRGHAQALKQRCVEEGVALLGVEFLTPSLARKKRGSLPGIGRNLQLLVLRDGIEARLAALGADDPARLLLQSLGSDLEAAAADFEELVRAGFGASAFGRPELATLFGELEEWVREHGYALGPEQDRSEAISPPQAGASVAGRLLVVAGGAEGWPDFFGLVALARRCPSVVVALSVPEFEGRSDAGETWVAQWEKALDAEKQSADSGEPGESCSAVAELWTGPGGCADRADVLLGATKADEMVAVADEVARLLAAGSENIAVVFPGAGPSHARLARLLAGRGVAFCDLIGVPGTPTVEIRIQRAMVDFYQKGCRLEELLALWPLLHEQSLAKLTLGEARRACERLFDEVQSHGVEEHVERLDRSKDEKQREVGRVARLLLPGWAKSLTSAEALGRFETARERLGIGEPPGWSSLGAFAARAPQSLSAQALLEAIRSFLPEQGPSSQAAGRGQFARVTLTTCRRAAGSAWSDCIFAESNLGVWPLRRESSCWLSDEERTELIDRNPLLSIRLPTTDTRAAQERGLYCAIARDTRRRVIFSAALSDEEDPELKLVPNPWLERVLWAKGHLTLAGGSGAFGTVPVVRQHAAVPQGGLEEWHRVWRSRRDPALPFDEFFLADPSGQFAPPKLSASQIQAAVEDPATLWFGSVLGVHRVNWAPFARERSKAVGTAVHRALAAAFGGTSHDGSFPPMPGRADVEERLALELSGERARWPKDRYWDSFHLDVARATGRLVAWVYALPGRARGAAEVRLPEGASVPVGKGRRLEVIGKMDMVLCDLPRWSGAEMEVVDYKTGGDAALSAKSMASRGASLQLGVYLEAARSLGATGNVWMLRPEERPRNLPMEAMERACAKLVVIGDHLSTGICGALTVDRTDYTHGFEWPLACTAIPHAVLRMKFEATFGAAEAGDEEDADE